MKAWEEKCGKAYGAYLEMLANATEWVRQKTGYDIAREYGRMCKKEEKERQEHWGRWALKKLAKGTLFGLFGSYIGSGSSDR